MEGLHKAYDFQLVRCSECGLPTIVLRDEVGEVITIGHFDVAYVDEVVAQLQKLRDDYLRSYVRVN